MSSGEFELRDIKKANKCFFAKKKKCLEQAAVHQNVTSKKLASFLEIPSYVESGRMSYEGTNGINSKKSVSGCYHVLVLSLVAEFR